jgi:4-aminobutyrate aminotransferase
MDLTKDRGLLIGKGGLDGNVIRIQPPLELTQAEADNACSILDDVFTQVEKNI